MKKGKIINIISIVITVLVTTIGVLVTSKYSKSFIPVSNSNIKLDIDMSRWSYDVDNNVYYQMQVNYCSKPRVPKLQTLGIYVPGEYLNGIENKDKTYSCKINKNGKRAGYTSELAPIIISVNTEDYKAQDEPEEYKYSAISDYIESGYIYIQPGFRGKVESNQEQDNEHYSKEIIESVTDLKAVVKFCRFNKDKLPGNSEKIISFGINGGGTKSAILGASGDSELYYSELLSIGAIINDLNGNWISDSVNGTMCCSPILNLEMTEESYAWSIEQYLNKKNSGLNEEILDNVSRYANYINDMNFKSEDGTLLYLEESDTGIYNKGTYYDYILNEVELALNKFLVNTEFPYTNKKRNITYKTPKEYINSLNNKNKWVIEKANIDQIRMSGIKDFVLNCYSDSTKKVKKILSEETNPLYFLSNKYDGEGSSYISRHWNICSEVDSNNIDLSSEENLKLVLQNNEDVRKVNYTAFWGREYSLEEKEKMYVENLKSWIKECF